MFIGREKLILQIFFFYFIISARSLHCKIYKLLTHIDKINTVINGNVLTVKLCAKASATP